MVAYMFEKLFNDEITLSPWQCLPHNQGLEVSLPAPFARVSRPNVACQEHRNIMKEFNEDFEIKRVPRPGE